MSDDQQPDEPTFDGSLFDRLTPEQQELVRQGRSPYYVPPTTPEELLQDVRAERTVHALDGVMAVRTSLSDFEKALLPSDLVADLKVVLDRIVEHLVRDGVFPN